VLICGTRQHLNKHQNTPLVSVRKLALIQANGLNTNQLAASKCTEQYIIYRTGINLQLGAEHVE